MNGGYRSSTTALLAVTDANWRIGGIGDFNNDGQLDIFWHHQLYGYNHVWFMNGATRTSFLDLPSFSNSNWVSVTIGYFGGLTDKNVDTVWRDKLYGSMNIWNMTGTTFSSLTSLPTQSDLNWVVIGAADMNNDGHTDIVWHHRVWGQVGVRWHSG